MRDYDPDYAANKKSKDSIVYLTATGKIKLTAADFDSKEEFLKWKNISDEMYKDSRRSDRAITRRTDFSFDQHSIRAVDKMLNSHDRRSARSRRARIID